jgi:hypothetical protein
MAMVVERPGPIENLPACVNRPRQDYSAMKLSLMRLSLLYANSSLVL